MLRKYDVDIKVLYNDLVVVELPETATREEIIAAAQKKYEEDGPDSVEYGEHVFDDDTWTITRQGDLHYFPPVKSLME